MDLTGRKLVRDAGKTLALLMTEMHDDMAAIADDGVIGEIKQTAVAGLQLLADAAQWIGEQVQQDINVIGSAAANFLMLNGTVIGGYYMAKSAAIASQKMADDEDFYTAKIATARFYAQQIMPRAQAYAEAMRSDVDTVMSLAESQF
ncbi:MAG: acyl-CoA dehydrogenase C-terminal domain-containing protein, partial [Gammaproteobacteria bacterium]|nr:acyl-CoA dehydrogenase C-terminal domain-containing protein [Gammaproteobacteria bacterium]